jgi:hypothetical protein
MTMEAWHHCSLQRYNWEAHFKRTLVACSAIELDEWRVETPICATYSNGMLHPGSGRLPEGVSERRCARRRAGLRYPSTSHAIEAAEIRPKPEERPTQQRHSAKLDARTKHVPAVSHICSLTRVPLKSVLWVTKNAPVVEAVPAGFHLSSV